MNKSFKMVLLEALLEHEGLIEHPTLKTLAQQSLAIFQRRRTLISDIREDLQNIDSLNPAQWQRYWDSNPVNAWIGGNRDGGAQALFQVTDDKFVPRFEVETEEWETLADLLQELVDFRFASYEARREPAKINNVVPLHPNSDKVELPFSKHQDSLRSIQNRACRCGRVS